MKLNKIQPLGLWIKNFLSYGNAVTYIPLNFKKPTLIIGRNMDESYEGKIDSNGSGKSVIINAISYALYDDTIGCKLTKDMLINNENNKDMLVGISFKKEENGNNVYYYIERFRKYKSKGGDGIRILRNTKNEFSFTKEFIENHDITQDSISKANKQIEEILGMSFAVFSRIWIYSSSHPQFFSLPTTSTSGTSQSDILEEIFDISILSEKSKNLKKILSANKAELETLTELNTSILAEKSRWNSQLNIVENSFNEWNKSKEQNINSLIKKNDFYKNIDFDEQYVLFEEIKKTENLINIAKIEKTNLETIINEQKIKNENYITWNTNKDSLIADIKNKISHLNTINFKTEYENLDKIEKLSKIIIDLNTQSKEFNKTLVNNDSTLNNSTIELKNIKESKCPYCSQHYVESVEKISALEAKILNLENTKITINDDLSRISSQINTFTEELNSLKNNTVFTTIKELTTAENSLKEFTNKLMDVTNSVNPYTLNSDLESIKNELSLKNDILIKLNNKNEKYKKLLMFESERMLIAANTEYKTLENELVKLEQDKNPHFEMFNNLKNLELPEDKNKEIELLKTIIYHDEFLYKLFTKKDSFVRKNLLKKNLTYLNDRLHHYLNKIGLSHKVLFNADMSTTISKFNKKYDYQQLSVGQKARVNIALSFAFRDVLQKLHGKVSLCILDECLDTGLGNVGIQMAAKMIKEVANTEKLSMFVISHRDEISAFFDSKIEIELRNKFSKIVGSDIGTETLKEESD